MLYVLFNSAGRSVEMTYVKPEITEYVEVADDLKGISLIKEGNSIRPMTEKEIEESLFVEKTKLASIAVNTQAVHLLAKSEQLVLPDAWESYTDAQKSQVKSYRDFLKNIEQQPGFPLKVEWPDLPDLKE